jgi:hypothetical protein
MDVYCHPFTSGGQEIPIQEAKLAELITLVTNYSCGEDYCTYESGGWPLEWAEYREPGTQFIKASTDPKSICDNLIKVWVMTPAQRSALGTKAREFVIEKCSIEAVGKQLEEILDAMPKITYDFEIEKKEYNAAYQPHNNQSDDDLIIDLHLNMLGEIIDHNSTSFKHWKGQLKNGLTKQQLFDHFKAVCAQLSGGKQIEFEDVLDKDDKGKRIAVVIPDSETDVFLINSLMRNLNKLYPSYNIYIITHPHNFQYIEDNVFIHKCITYSDSIDNAFLLEGIGNHEGYFEMAFFPNTATQKIVTYVHNGLDKTQFLLQ